MTARCLQADVSLPRGRGCRRGIPNIQESILRYWRVEEHLFTNAVVDKTSPSGDDTRTIFLKWGPLDRDDNQEAIEFFATLEESFRVPVNGGGGGIRRLLASCNRRRIHI